MFRFRRTPDETPSPSHPGTTPMSDETQPQSQPHAQPDSADLPIDAGDTLLTRIKELEAELDDAKARALRLMADFNNFQRRSMQNEIAAEQQGSAAVAMSVVPVIDHFDQALTLDPANSSAQQVIDGVKVIRDELLKALGKHGVRLLNPQRGEPFVPGTHEALMQQPADGVDSGCVVQVYQAGYALLTPNGERVLRPAKVVVAP